MECNHCFDSGLGCRGVELCKMCGKSHRPDLPLVSRQEDTDYNEQYGEQNAQRTADLCPAINEALIMEYFYEIDNFCLLFCQFCFSVRSKSACAYHE